MNVYSCWYKGTFGYCCRWYNHAWLFVPELGQPDNTIYKNVAFADLIFKDKSAEEYEKEYRLQRDRLYTVSLLQKLLRKKYKPQTIGGLLFCTVDTQ